MTSRRFVALALSLVALAALAVAGLGRWLNVYGQFGDVRGASYRPYGPRERAGKYLLARNYVPQSFDALLVGSSNAVNWDTHGITGYRMYNLAASGANAADEKILLETALERGHFRLVVFVINAYLTATHGEKTREMVPRQYWATLGSPELVSDLALSLATRRGLLADEHDDYGTDHFSRRPAPDDVKVMMDLAVARKLENHRKGLEFAVDPLGLEDLRATVEAARRHGARIVLVHPVMYRARFEVVAEEYAAFRAEIDPMFGPSAPVLDFNTSRYDALRDDLDGYYDHVHLSEKGAAASVRALDGFLREAL